MGGSKFAPAAEDGRGLRSAVRGGGGTGGGMGRGAGGWERASLSVGPRRLAGAAFGDAGVEGGAVLPRVGAVGDSTTTDGA